MLLSQLFPTKFVEDGEKFHLGVVNYSKFRGTSAGISRVFV